MQIDFKTTALFSEYKKWIDQVCERVLETRGATSIFAEDMAEVYGYPNGGGKVQWGVNKPDNILRGIRLPNGDDVGVM